MLFGIKAFVPRAPPGRQRVALIRAFTDNQGNGSLLNKLVTTKLPLALVIMELGAELGEAQAMLEASWVPRTHNVEADALANGVIDGFDISRRIRLAPEELRWHVLPRLLAELPRLREEAVQARAQRRARPGARATKGARLRETDPW